MRGSKKRAKDLLMSSNSHNTSSTTATNDVAIRVSNLGKCYQIYDNPSARLKQFWVPRLQQRREGDISYSTMTRNPHE